MTPDLHNVVLFYMYLNRAAGLGWVMVVGREEWQYVSLKTKQVCFSSDAFRCSGTRGELGY